MRRGVTVGRLAGTVTARQERKTRTGNRMGIVQFSVPTGQFEAVLFSEALNEYRDLLEPGTSVLVQVAAEDRPEGIGLRIGNVTPLDAVEAGLRQLRVFLRGEEPLPSIEKRLSRGGDGDVSLVLLHDGGEREVEVQLPGRYQLSPQIASALRAVSGIVEVELVCEPAFDYGARRPSGGSSATTGTRPTRPAPARPSGSSRTWRWGSRTTTPRRPSNGSSRLYAATARSSYAPRRCPARSWRPW